MIDFKSRSSVQLGILEYLKGDLAKCYYPRQVLMVRVLFYNKILLQNPHLVHHVSSVTLICWILGVWLFYLIDAYINLPGLVYISHGLRFLNGPIYAKPVPLSNDR